jgi:LPXTG-site transpeptidase (sortase) family protein
VSIPALGVQQDLIGLGVAGDGTAEVPTDFDDVGWFTPGGRPGARGPTVLMGHVDSTAGPAVFYDLRALAPGDVVELTVADGSTATYTVTGTEQVAKDTFPTAAVFGATTQDVLRLITCTGAFDAGARSYTDNLVVTAVRSG